MQPGTRVEVRSRFEPSWSRGFEVAEVVDEHDDPSIDGRAYRVRRRSDGEVLPALFSEEELREERKGRSMWWH